MLQPIDLPPARTSAQAVRSRAGIIADAIRQAVVEQRIAPGTRLSEDQIGILFGASRTIVRAALQELAHDNIVSLAKNRGASVAAPTVADAQHLFDARQGIEDLIVRRAALHMTASTAAALDDLVARGEAAVRDDDRGLAIRLSGEFHLAIAAVADQPVLHSFLSELVSRTSLVIALYGGSRSADCREDDHRSVLAALRARDGARAAALMREHLAHIAADLDLTGRERPRTSLRDALLPGAGAGRPQPGDGD